MEYLPQEGVDYITDLYQVIGVPNAAAQDDITHALNARLKEYHPDRLQGLAPEFQEKGERMARMLNRARVILTDDGKRAEYDQILSEWNGPVSADGTPVMRMEDLLRSSMAGTSIEDIETMFAAQRKQITSITKHDPRQQALLGRMFAAAGDEDIEDLREAYDKALFAEDQVLAIEEAERGQLLGLTHNQRYEVGMGYGNAVNRAIEQTRTAQVEAYGRRVLGGVGTRLALLAGDAPQDVRRSVAEPQGVLPHYFDSVAQKIADIAARREALLLKRLEIFVPTYPVAEIQTEPKPYFAVGITNDADAVAAAYGWIGFHFDAQQTVLSNIEVPDDVQVLLANGAYQEAYAAGFNVLTFATKDHIDLKVLLEEACNKHVQKYFYGSVS